MLIKGILICFGKALAMRLAMLFGVAPARSDCPPGLLLNKTQ
jgi:hypothetical protein